MVNSDHAKLICVRLHRKKSSQHLVPMTVLPFIGTSEDWKDRLAGISAKAESYLWGGVAQGQAGVHQLKRSFAEKAPGILVDNNVFFYCNDGQHQNLHFPLNVCFADTQKPIWTWTACSKLLSFSSGVDQAISRVQCWPQLFGDCVFLRIEQKFDHCSLWMKKRK